MIRLVVLTTNSTEHGLLFRLCSRGQRPHDPTYFSEKREMLEEGWVTFERGLDEIETFRVQVAGNRLVVNSKRLSLVKGWLADWQIRTSGIEECQVRSLSNLRDFFARLRRKHGESGRAESLQKVRGMLEDWRTQVVETILESSQV